MLCLPSIRVTPYILCPVWANGGSADTSFMHGMVLVLWEVEAILGNGYGIQGQNYVAFIQGSGMPAGFLSRNLILGI